VTEWVNGVAAVTAVGISLVSLVRSSRKEDSEAADKRIDERIKLVLGEDIAVIKFTLTAIQTTLAGNTANNSSLVSKAVSATADAIKDAAVSLNDARFAIRKRGGAS
jgi:hypothetical protein